MKLPSEHLVDEGAVARFTEDVEIDLGPGCGGGEGVVVKAKLFEHLPDIITVEFIMAWLTEAGYKTAQGKLLPVAKVIGPKDMEIKLLHRELQLARTVRDRYRQTLAVVRALAEGDSCQCTEVVSAVRSVL